MYDLFGLGNAIVDIEVSIEESFLQKHDISRGHMTLIDDERMHQLLEELNDLPMQRCSGGSAANTIFSAQSFGLNTAYTCKVASDQTGDFFVREMSDAGIILNASIRADHGRSGECLVMISDDAQRTMNTNLGVSSEAASDDVNLKLLQQSRYFYVEGYASSSPATTAAAILCREQAHQHNVLSSVSLSDPTMVEFCRDALEQILGNGVSLIFCNEEEALAWARTDRLDIAINELKDIAPELYVTLGPNGSIAITGGEQKHAAGVPVAAVDSTGAGDIYAGACIAARCQGASAYDAARFANHCASHVVGRYGARLKQREEYQSLQDSFS